MEVIIKQGKGFFLRRVDIGTVDFFDGIFSAILTAINFSSLSSARNKANQRKKSTYFLLDIINLIVYTCRWRDLERPLAFQPEVGWLFKLQRQHDPSKKSFVIRRDILITNVTF